MVLVNGTVEDSDANRSRLAPRLAADGYCVYVFNYGGTPGSPIQQTGPMRTSARQLAGFVDTVLAATGARTADLVGHSQGGLLPLYYINRLGGDTKVHRMVGLEPASRGVHAYGLLPLISAVPAGSALLGATLPAAVDFTAGSDFMRETAQGGYTRADVQYTTVISRTDALITVAEAQLPPPRTPRHAAVPPGAAPPATAAVGAGTGSGRDSLR